MAYESPRPMREPITGPKKALTSAGRKNLPTQMVRFLMTFFQILWAKLGPRRREGKQKPRAPPESQHPGGR